MKKLLTGIMVLSLVCVFALAAGADVKGTVTNQTRDILLMEEIGDSADPVPIQDTPDGLSAMDLFNNDFEVVLTADKPDGLYNVGDKIVFSVTSERDGYLTLLDFTPSGQIVVLYPNAWAEDGKISAGETVVVPAESEYSLRAGGPVGVDVVKAIVTEKQVQVYDEANRDVVGQFSILKDAVAATRDILLMAEPDIAIDPDDPDQGDTGETNWAVASFAVMTNEEGSEAPTGFAVVEKGDWRAKMWANNNDFLIGERVFVKFLSNKAGKLVSLVNSGASAKENDLLPEGEEVTFDAGEILTLPRVEDKWKLVAAEDAGQDAILAKLALDDGTELDIEIKLVVTNDLEG